jgi:hypothetical protein
MGQASSWVAYYLEELERKKMVFVGLVEQAR